MKYFLRTETEAQMNAALFEAGVIETSPVDGSLWPKPGYSLLRIPLFQVFKGFAATQPGASGPEPVFETFSGYHANLTADALAPDQIAKLPIIPAPDTPVFA